MNGAKHRNVTSAVKWRQVVLQKGLFLVLLWTFQRYHFMHALFCFAQIDLSFHREH